MFFLKNKFRLRVSKVFEAKTTQMPPDPPRCLQLPQDASRCLLVPPRCFQMPPRCLPDASRCLSDAYRCLQMPPDASDLSPWGAPGDPKSLRCLPDASQMPPRYLDAFQMPPSDDDNPCGITFMSWHGSDHPGSHLGA